MLSRAMYGIDSVEGSACRATLYLPVVPHQKEIVLCIFFRVVPGPAISILCPITWQGITLTRDFLRSKPAGLNANLSKINYMPCIVWESGLPTDKSSFRPGSLSRNPSRWSFARDITTNLQETAFITHCAVGNADPTWAWTCSDVVDSPHMRSRS